MDMRFAKRTGFKATYTILTVGFLGLLSVQALANEQLDLDVPVSVSAVHFKAVAKPVVASGSIRPISEQALAFKVSGFVDKVLVREGQYLKKGEPMAILVLDEIDAQVAKARALLDNATRQLARISTLKGRQLASDERNRQAQTSVQVATSDLQIAKFNRKHAVIHAPANGRVLTRHIETHELIQPGQQAFVFADEQQGWSVRLSVADVDVVKLQLNDQASIKLDAYPGKNFSGHIREIAGRADIRSQTFEVDVLLNKAPRLYSGLIAHTQITPSHTQSLAAVPLSALIEANGIHARIYVLDQENLASLRSVNIAYINGAYAMISSGVLEGERVVVQGGPFILDGAAIAIHNELDQNPIQILAK
jgi:multidrug efflux system membrane fusion protein